jgi:hypothetical protein
VTLKVRSESCTACPYRRDVPSGVWSAVEYDKLADYDKPTAEQPMQYFGCHATPEFICHGWAVVHGRQDHEHELVSLRLAASLGVYDMDTEIPAEGVPLFSSGTEAAEHGKRDILNPSPEAKEVSARLASKYKRLEWG